MYPGVMFHKPLSFENHAWNVVLYLAAFGIFDTIGKNAAGIKSLIG